MVLLLLLVGGWNSCKKEKREGEESEYSAVRLLVGGRAVCFSAKLICRRRPLSEKEEQGKQSKGRAKQSKGRAKQSKDKAKGNLRLKTLRLKARGKEGKVVIFGKWVSRTCWIDCGLAGGRKN